MGGFLKLQNLLFSECFDYLVCISGLSLGNTNGQFRQNLKLFCYHRYVPHVYLNVPSLVKTLVYFLTFPGIQVCKFHLSPNSHVFQYPADSFITNPSHYLIAIHLPIITWPCLPYFKLYFKTKPINMLQTGEYGVVWDTSICFYEEKQLCLISSVVMFCDVQSMYLLDLLPAWH